MGVSLFEHNQTAYDAAISMLNTTGKAAVIHPTGTGKSFIAFKLCEENPQKTVCWLSPSEYIFYTQVENWKAAGGEFQQQSRHKEENKIVIKNGYIYFYTYAKLMRMSKKSLEKIQPDYIILDEFHRCGAAGWGSGVKKLLELYPKAKVLGLSATSIRYLDNQRDMAWELFEGNTASELSLGAAVARGILPMPKYVLSVYSIQEQIQNYKIKIQQIKNKAVRNTAEKQLESLRRALDQAEGLDKVFAKHIKPLKNTRNKYGKYLVFCANYNHLNEMKALAAKWFAKIDKNPNIYTVCSECQEAAKELEAFKADQSSHLKLLYCIDMLNEGVHIEEIDGVILLRPTVSPIIYKQQIGRALAAGGKKQPVIFDIVMNIENLFSIGAIEKEFREAVLLYHKTEQEDKVFQKSFQIIDEVKDCRALFLKLNETLGAPWDAMYQLAERYYKEHGHLNMPKRYKTSEGYSLGMWIATQRNVYAGKTSGNLSELQIKKLSAIGMRWQGSSDRIWEKYYAKAAEYYQKYGNLQLGIDNYKTRTTDQFLLDTKEVKISGNINEDLTSVRKTSENINKNSTGIREITENANKGLIDTTIDQPKIVVKQEDCYASLSRWLARLRAERKRMEIPDTTLNQKEDLLKSDDTLDNKKNFSDSKNILTAQSSECFLDSKLTQRDKDILSDRNTVTEKEISEKSKKENIFLTPERIAALNVLGMVWDTPDVIWEQHYNAAEQYYKEHHNLDIPKYYVNADGICLGRWIARQRKLWQRENNSQEEIKSSGDYKNCLTKQRIIKLSAIGMNWNKKNNTTWEQSYRAALEYFKIHGNLDIPVAYRTSDGYQLGRWVHRQKDLYKKTENKLEENNKKTTTKLTSLKEQRKEKLKQIGIIKDNCSTPEKESDKMQNKKNSLEDAWERMYHYAEQFYLEQGHLFISKRYTDKDGTNLGSWLVRQRANYKKGILTEYQIQKLNKIGMVWEIENPWELGYRHAKQYFSKFENLSVPYTYFCEDGYQLGKWISNQRCAYHNLAGKKLNADQIQKLSAIGMLWSAKPGRAKEKLLSSQ